MFASPELPDLCETTGRMVTGGEDACVLDFVDLESGKNEDELTAETCANFLTDCHDALVYEDRTGRDDEFVSSRIRANNGTKGPFLCDFCAVSIGTVTALEVHLAAIHGVRKKFTCLRCNFSSNKRSLLLDHIRWSREGKLVKCSRRGCDARFATVDDRRRHVVEEHEPLRCPVCLDGFNSYNALDRHKMKNHVELYNETELSCKVCARHQFMVKTLFSNFLTW
jgi:hypothetical protein